MSNIFIHYLIRQKTMNLKSHFSEEKIRQECFDNQRLGRDASTLIFECRHCGTEFLRWTYLFTCIACGRLDAYPTYHARIEDGKLRLKRIQ